MKNFRSKLYFFFALFFCFPNFIFSQEVSSFLDGGLWIKGSDSKINSANASNYEQDLKCYLNYNSPVNFSSDKISKKYRNLVNKKSSLFVVLKSSSVEENQLLTLERGVFKSSLTTKKMTCDKEVTINKGNLKTGIVLSYLFNKNSLTGKKNGSLIFDDLLFGDIELKKQLLELIYIPRFVSDKEKNIIESYLGLKYGISLKEESNYYDSNGNTIWDLKENEGFNNRITGIGKDDRFELNQKQSKNSLNDGLILGLEKIQKTNYENKVSMTDKTFLLWGDNGKSIVLEENKNDFRKTMKRVWKLRAISDILFKDKIQLKIDKKLMPIETDLVSSEKDFMWLAIDTVSVNKFNYLNAKYIKATVNNDNEIIFDDIVFNTYKDLLFTIVKAPENLVSKNLVSLNEINNSPIVENILTDQYVLYPNPISSSEKFSVKFNLKESSKVLIQITDINGKIVKTKDLGFIDELIYNEILPVSGTYLILISINGELETSKLIVK